MSVERLISLLEQNFDFGGREIAEMFWLLMQWKIEEVKTEIAQPERTEPDSKRGESLEIQTEESQQRDDRQPASVSVYTQPPEPQEQGVLPTKALPIWVSDAPTVDNALELMRSLRPLLKKVAVGTQAKLNEPATVDRIAQTDIWIPVLEPEVEPWFEVALIFDTSPSMTLWRRTLEELELCLKRYGAFRDLRTWELEVNNGEVHLRANATGSLHSYKEILPPDQRRITIIFSDCVANYWWDGSLFPTLTQWATAMPTAIWQMFPEWMWERTALGNGYGVSLRGTTEGATNQQLQAKALSLWDIDNLEGGTKLPIVTTDPKSLGAWSRILSGKRDITMAGIVLPLPEPKEKTERTEKPEPKENDNNAVDRVQRFRLLSSSQARRLAGLLSAAPVITLPVMRLIRASMMPGSSVLPVAEVFLGGLLKPLSNSSPQSDLDLIQYDFAPGIRAELLDTLPKVDALEVLNEVSGYIADRLGKSLREFRALVLDSQSAEKEGLQAFARIAAEIVGRLGSEYAQFANQLASAGGGLKEPPQPESNSEPLLQEGSFEIATIEIEETVIFTSDVGTLEPQSSRGQSNENQWVIRKRKQEFTGVIEELPEGVTLELAEIPPGKFIMGSPKTERDRADAEGPQHEVNVSGFLMGRYTITQAQWRAVVNNVPMIVRELNPEPSRFKGDNRPVEQISWQDAVEFCARLSQYTKKQYVLPSEAQWEYACRAGTSKPFHFGETLTTEIANYDGNYTYGKGLKGEYRKETTVVGHFGVTNAFGLYDMHGNVWEWCADPWHSNYEGAPEDGSVWDENCNDNRYQSYDNDFLVNLIESDRPRVRRGGSWSFYPWNCRCAFRNYYNPVIQYNGTGLRVIRFPPRTL